MIPANDVFVLSPPTVNVGVAAVPLLVTVPPEPESDPSVSLKFAKSNVVPPLTVTAELTPNAPEATALTGMAIDSLAGLHAAGRALMAMGAKAVLMKGGHLEGDTVTDVLLSSEGARIFAAPRLQSRHTHGTGCTLASACATGLAQGLSMEHSVERAIDYVRTAIARAPGLGGGHGPLDHGWPLR